MQKKAEAAASAEPLAEETTTSRSSQTWAMLIKQILASSIWPFHLLE